jgi:hypothetical protein
VYEGDCDKIKMVMRAPRMGGGAILLAVYLSHCDRIISHSEFLIKISSHFIFEF